MKHLYGLLEKVKKTEFNINDNGTIKQTERNALKTKLLEAFMADLGEIVVGRASEGVYLELPNDVEGSIPVVLDIKIKNTTIDTYAPIQEYELKQKEKLERAKKQKKERQASYKNQMAIKAKKEKDV